MWAFMGPRGLKHPLQSYLRVWMGLNVPTAELAEGCRQERILAPLFPDLTLRPAQPLSCWLACKGICPRRALGSLIRKVVTDTLAAKVRGGELRAVTKLRKTKCMPLSGMLGPVWATGCSWGGGKRQCPKCRVVPRAGTCSWDSRPRGGGSSHHSSFLLPAS